ncbi:MAG: SAM-dependent methyltransferase [Bacteroidales bacterium]|nr:SAM-dependent methyltransferase [Bacteroidales bacterium]
MKKGNLYLIPTTLGDQSDLSRIIPEYNHQIVHTLKHFIVEKTRTARRFLKQTGHPVPIDDMSFLELNKHTQPNEVHKFLEAAEQGNSMGMISEAGTPAVADPGSVIVQLAHQKRIKVIPLVGPNSLILSLMASGMNGQQFTFHGYLPKDTNDLTRKIKTMEADVLRTGTTQIFIETPFRNNKLLDNLIQNCNPKTLLCVAVHVTLPDEQILTQTIAQWKKEKADLNKKPAVFLLGK